MGFAFPEDMGEAVVIKSDRQKFVMPRSSDLRSNWVPGRLVAIDNTEVQALVINAWAKVVRNGIAAALIANHASPADARRS
jgi:hypothetical protein